MNYFVSVILKKIPLKQCQRFLMMATMLLAFNAAKSQSCDSASIYYYSVDGKYPLSTATLLDYVTRYIADLQAIHGSGYITFRFTINCEGKMGNELEVLQVDDDYKKTSFELPLVDKLKNFVKQLDKWKRAKSKDGSPLAYRAFMSFKINNGKIINIIP